MCHLHSLTSTGQLVKYSSFTEAIKCIFLWWSDNWFHTPDPHPPLQQTNEPPPVSVWDSLSMASELKVRAVSRDRQSTVTSPPWMRYQLCLRGVEPSNLSWKPVLELSFIPMRTSSRAHWAECFPARIRRTKERRWDVRKAFVKCKLLLFFNVCSHPAVAATSGTLCMGFWLQEAARWSQPGAPGRSWSPAPSGTATGRRCW